MIIIIYIIYNLHRLLNKQEPSEKLLNGLPVELVYFDWFGCRWKAPQTLAPRLKPKLTLPNFLRGTFVSRLFTCYHWFLPSCLIRFQFCIPFIISFISINCIIERCHHFWICFPFHLYWILDILSHFNFLFLL